MRRVIPAILASLLLIHTSRAQEPAPAPAPAPAQAPAAQPPQVERAPTRILVLPFNLTGGEGRHAWIGQAIAENFQAELAKAGFAIAPAMVNGPVNVGIADMNQAIRIANDSKAEVVIFGSYHFVDPDLRVTGQIVDVASGLPVGAIKANGTFRQLFTLEDQLVEQAKKLMMGPDAAAELPAMGPDEKPVPGPAGFDVNTTAEDDKTEYKLPYREDPPAYDDDYLGLDYTTTYWPSYYRPRLYTSYYSSYYDWYPSYWHYPAYSYYYSPWYDCYRPRPWFGSGLFFSFHFGHHHRHHWNGHHHWRHHWGGHDHWRRDFRHDHHRDRWVGSGWSSSDRRWNVDRGTRFGDRDRNVGSRDGRRQPSILVRDSVERRERDSGGGRALMSLARPQYVTRSIDQQRNTASRVIRVDRHAPIQPRDSSARTSSGRETVTIRHPDRTVEVRTQRRPDSDSSWDPAQRTFTRPESGNTQGNSRTRDDSAARDTARARDNDRAATRDNDRPTATRDPVRTREPDRTPVREAPRESQPRELPRDNARLAPRESAPRESAPRESAPAREAPRSIDRGSPRESAPAREAPRSIDRGSSSRSDSGSIRSGGSSSFRDSGSSRSSGGASVRDSGSSRSSGGGSFRSESGGSRSSSGGSSSRSSSGGGGGGRSSGRGR